MLTDSGGNHQWMLKNGPSSSVTEPLAMWLWWSPKKRWNLFSLSCTSQLSPDGLDNKESAWNAGDTGSIPELGTSPGEGNGYPCSNITEQWKLIFSFPMWQGPANFSLPTPLLKKYIVLSV